MSQETERISSEIQQPQMPVESELDDLLVTNSNLFQNFSTSNNIPIPDHDILTSAMNMAMGENPGELIEPLLLAKATNDTPDSEMTMVENIPIQKKVEESKKSEKAEATPEETANNLNQDNHIIDAIIGSTLFQIIWIFIRYRNQVVAAV